MYVSADYLVLCDKCSMHTVKPCEKQRAYNFTEIKFMNLLGLMLDCLLSWSGSIVQPSPVGRPAFANWLSTLPPPNIVLATRILLLIVCNGKPQILSDMSPFINP